MFLGNSLHSHIGSDWRVVCTTELLEQDLNTCEIVKVLETKSFECHKPLAFLELISI
jgi:hypothetical protein